MKIENMEKLNKLSDKHTAMFMMELNENQYNTSIAYALWFFLGFFGAHKIYLGKYLQAFMFFITFGGLGIWWLFDALGIKFEVEKLNEMKETELLNKYVMMFGKSDDIKTTDEIEFLEWREC